MNDLIRRGALEMVLLRETAWYDNSDEDVAYAAVQAAPSVDAVEVVRCKECKNSGMMVPIGGKRPNRICWLHDLQVTDKDFCSFGTRMDAQMDGEKEAEQDG